MSRIGGGSPRSMPASATTSSRSGTRRDLSLTKALDGVGVRRESSGQHSKRAQDVRLEQRIRRRRRAASCIEIPSAAARSRSSLPSLCEPKCRSHRAMVSVDTRPKTRSIAVLRGFESTAQLVGFSFMARHDPNPHHDASHCGRFSSVQVEGSRLPTCWPTSTPPTPASTSGCSTTPTHCASSSTSSLPTTMCATSTVSTPRINPTARPSASSPPSPVAERVSS